MKDKLTKTTKCALGLALASLAIWVFIQDSIGVPSKYYSGDREIGFPSTLFIGGFFLLLGICFIANAFAPVKSARFCKIAAPTAFTLLFLGYVVIDPIFG